MVVATAVPKNAPDQIGDRRQQHGLPRREHFGGNDGGDGIGGVVKAVDVGEHQRHKNDDENEEHRRDQEFFRTMCMTTLPASWQRSMTFSISS